MYKKGEKKKMNEPRDKIVTVTLILLLSLFLQIMFGFADVRDTPNKAVAEFAKAYFRFDPSMSDRLCEEAKTADDKNVVEQYIDRAVKEAAERGYSLFYMKESLYHVETHLLNENATSAEVRLVCQTKPPLQSFFTKKSSEVDETLKLKKEKGVWKVCGRPFSL